MAGEKVGAAAKQAVKQEIKRQVRRYVIANPVVIAIAIVVLVAVAGTAAMLTFLAAASHATAAPTPPGVCVGSSDDETSTTTVTVILHFAGVTLGGKPLSADQKSNALAIAGTVKGEGGSRRDAKVALMTAIQESNLHILSYGDKAGPDSRGLFQQRDSWGPLAVRMSAVGSTKLFLENPTRGLFNIPDRDSLSLIDEALAVQGADPNAYRQPGHAFLDWEVPVEMMLGNTYGPQLVKAAPPTSTIPTIPSEDPTVSAPCVPVVTTGEYGPPLQPMVDSQIGCPFQGTHTYYHNWQSDNAVDLPTPVGTLVIAVADGVIGPRIGAFNTDKSNLQGQRLTLETDGNDFYYMHLSQILPSITPGTHVKQGDPLGYSGKSGAAHLHFGMHAEFNPADAIGMSPSVCPDSNWAWPSWLPRDTKADDGSPLKSS